MASTRTLHTVRAATSLATARPAYAAGLRAAVATVIPLVADAVLHTGGGSWMSLGGFNVALSDRGGAYRIRATTMGAVTFCTALAMALGTLSAGHVALALPMTFAVALAASLARVWGAAGASVGGAALSTFVIALAYPAATAGELLGRPAYALVGGLLAMAIALVVWPLQPYRPARRAVGASYRALADYAESVAAHIEAETAGVRSELPAGSATVRAALEEARTALTQGRRGRSGTTAREQRLVVLSEVVDQLFGHLVAIAETVDSIGRDDRLLDADAAITSAIHALAANARMLAAAVEAEDDGAPVVEVAWGGALLNDVLVDSGDAHDDMVAEHYRHAAAMLDRAAQYAGVAAETGAAMNRGHSIQPTMRTPVTEELEDQLSPFTALRAVLSPDSLILRYALRVAVVTTLAVLLAELLHLKRGYWMTITVIVILQPYSGITTQRALQRVIGTVVGALITAALGALFHGPTAILVLSFVFAAACVSLLPVNYAAYSVFLTPTFVLLAEASAGDWHLAGTRAMNTVLGGVLALAGSRLLWPSPETSRLPGYLAESFRANRDYLRAVVALYADRSERAGETLRAARRRIGLATVNAEESFQRLLGEFTGPAGDLSPVLTLLTYTRRLTASIAALALARHTSPGVSTATLAPFLASATAVLDDLAVSIAEDRAPAALPTVAVIDPGAPLIVRARVERLARQIRLLHDAVARWKHA